MGRSYFIPDFHVSPEQTKTHESSHFIKEFHVFWFISDIYKMGLAVLPRLFVFWFHFAP